METIRQIAAVAVVLGLLCGLLWLQKHRGVLALRPLAHVRGRRMVCVERLQLGSQHAIHLIRLGGRGLLVASSPSGCALMESFPWRGLESEREDVR